MALGARRDATRPLTDALARPFVALGLSPNALTVVGAILVLVPSYFASQARWLEAGVALGLVSCIDFLDGAVARAKNQTTAFGGWLDSLLDRLSDGTILIGIGLGLDSRRAWTIVGAALIAQYLTSYARARAYQDARPPPETWNQFFERPERVIFLTTALLAQSLIDRARPETGVLEWLLLAFALMAFWATLRRTIRVYRLLGTTSK